MNPYTNYGYAVATLNAFRTPNKTALSYRGTHYSFAELNNRINRTANALLAIGLKQGSKMGVLIHDALPIAETYLALAKLGVTIVALNPYWDDEVMQAMLEHCEVDSLLSQSRDHERITKIIKGLSGKRLWIQLEEEQLPQGIQSLDIAKKHADASEPPIAEGGENPLAYFFTSGTTSLPKAVVHSHNSCRAMADIWNALPRSENAVWGTGTIIWGIGFPCTIGAALYVGMHVVLEDNFGPDGLLDAIQREPISHFCVIPSFWADLLANHPHEEVDLSSIKMVLLGGEPLAKNLLAKIKQRIPDAQLFAFYGQTEAPYTCIGRLDDGSQAANVSGPARPSCAARVLGPSGDPVVGQTGELAITGPHCMQGYFAQPEKTAEAIRDGWFFSGDLAMQDEVGRITVLGRREDAIAKGSQYILPLEIEDAAMGIEGVVEAGAVSVDTRAEDQKILLAVTVRNNLTEQDIFKQLETSLSRHALPDRIVLADELPHNNDNSGGKGKLLRREIRNRYAHLLTD